MINQMITKYIKVDYTNGTIFVKNGDKSLKSVTFDNLSIDFIKGFDLSCRLIGNEIIRISESDSFSSDPIIIFSDYDVKLANTINSNIKITDQPNFFRRICDDLNVKINSKYSAVVEQLDCSTDIIQFDSIDFISGFMSCASWISLSSIISPRFLGIFDNFKTCKFTIEYQLPIMIYHEKAKEEILKLHILGITEIICDYLLGNCSVS